MAPGSIMENRIMVFVVQLNRNAFGAQIRCEGSIFVADLL